MLIRALSPNSLITTDKRLPPPIRRSRLCSHPQKRTDFQSVSSALGRPCLFRQVAAPSQLQTIGKTNRPNRYRQHLQMSVATYAGERISRNGPADGIDDGHPRFSYRSRQDPLNPRQPPSPRPHPPKPRPPTRQPQRQNQIVMRPDPLRPIRVMTARANLYPHPHQLPHQLSTHRHPPRHSQLPQIQRHL